MGENFDPQPLQSDWYSPTRLRSSPVKYDFPGDRFIPNRSLMDLDQARSLLTTRTDKELENPNFNDEYRRKLKENLTLDVEGRPFRMLVFRGSPKSDRKSSRLIVEMRRSDEEVPWKSNRTRSFPKKELAILDAPLLENDFYLNVLDWGHRNVLAVILGPALYTWNAFNKAIHKLLEVNSDDDYPTSVAWSDDGKRIAVGFMSSNVQLWDAETSKLVRSLGGHEDKVGSVTWKNGHVLTTGGNDKAIINHDVRARNSLTCCVRVHTDKICSLKWSETGHILASGGDDNLVYILHSSKMSSSHYLHCLKDHSSAVKALDWCPHNSSVLASGGGLHDGSLKIWDVQKGVCINSIDTKAQICGLQWNRHHKEILSAHGWGSMGSNCDNQLCLWKYPSMSRIGSSVRHESRFLHLTQSPDGSTVATAGADQLVRLWEAFGQPLADKPSSGLDDILSYKTSPLR
ncbi:OLC1v1027057C1 [Oldenlandia corymbosa var. corymbosa]|uniref:OLC1v1027057C1 n=1 Tax=Oldenlandia corymbosa var. corymbosa TaxID=529605 RepID=A0AAV1C8V0_OLDCO|nr:OLC1v1027057C1 [Oldenlandia corymbosa var. corymbosa]